MGKKHSEQGKSGLVPSAGDRNRKYRHATDSRRKKGLLRWWGGKDTGFHEMEKEWGHITWQKSIPCKKQRTVAAHPAGVAEGRGVSTEVTQIWGSGGKEARSAVREGKKTGVCRTSEKAPDHFEEKTEHLKGADWSTERAGGLLADVLSGGDSNRQR